MSFAVVGPGDGAEYDFGGARFTVKADGSRTGGQLAVMEMLCPAGLQVPAHVHDGEDEMFYVVSGELTGFCGAQQWSAQPGAFVFLPRDVQHGFVAGGPTAAKVLVVVAPPRFDAHVARWGIRILPGPSHGAGETTDAG